MLSLAIFGRKWAREHNHARFDMIDLQQFKSHSFRYISGYVFMYVMILIALAAFASDIYTAVMLLAFDRWSSSIKPYVPFRVSRWLFAGCIILSVVLYIYDFIVAIKTIREKNISLNYTNPISRNLYSIRGYRYFCLFAKVTKSKSRIEYLALFTYFTFKGWIRLVFAESPRQVLNALTLYSVLKIDDDFVEAVQELATHSTLEAVVVSFMAFSLVIWVINVLQFLFALLCALPLYVHIEKECSGLDEFCCVRVNRRIQKLVEKHHTKGLIKLAQENRKLKAQPTLPEFPAFDAPEKPTFRHQHSNASLTSVSSTTDLLAHKPSFHADERAPFASRPVPQQIPQRSPYRPTGPVQRPAVDAPYSRTPMSRADTSGSFGPVAVPGRTNTHGLGAGPTPAGRARNPVTRANTSDYYNNSNSSRSDINSNSNNTKGDHTNNPIDHNLRAPVERLATQDSHLGIEHATESEVRQQHAGQQVPGNRDGARPPASNAFPDQPSFPEPASNTNTAVPGPLPRTAFPKSPLEELKKAQTRRAKQEKFVMPLTPGQKFAMSSSSDTSLSTTASGHDPHSSNDSSYIIDSYVENNKPHDPVTGPEYWTDSYAGRDDSQFHQPQALPLQHPTSNTDTNDIELDLLSTASPDLHQTRPEPQSIRRDPFDSLEHQQPSPTTKLTRADPFENLEQLKSPTSSNSPVSPTRSDPFDNLEQVKSQKSVRTNPFDNLEKLRSSPATSPTRTDIFDNVDETHESANTKVFEPTGDTAPRTNPFDRLSQLSSPRTRSIVQPLQEPTVPNITSSQDGTAPRTNPFDRLSQFNTPNTRSIVQPLQEPTVPNVSSSDSEDDYDMIMDNINGQHSHTQHYDWV